MQEPSLAISSAAFIIVYEEGHTLETMTTRKSFSLILRDSTFAVSFKIFPIHFSLYLLPSSRQLTRVDEFLILDRECLGFLDLLLEIADLVISSRRLRHVEKMDIQSLSPLPRGRTTFLSALYTEQRTISLPCSVQS